MNKYKTMGFTTIGLIGGASIATGAYFVFNTFEVKPPQPEYQYGKAVSKKIFNGINIDMHEVNPEEKDEKNKEFFLSDDGLKALVYKIENNLNIGPEFFDLNKITIDDKNQINIDSNGNYYPSKDTINLSSSQFRNEGLGTVKKGDEDIIPSQEVKVELLFQVFFHEYGHFLANKYLNGFSKNESGKILGWNKDFEDNFEHILGYDKPAAPLLKIVKNQAWQSMGALYSASDLYQRVNITKDLKFPEMDSKEWHPIWAGVEPFFDTSKKESAVDKTKMPYLWSLDEIYTRKVEQAMFTYNAVGSQENFLGGHIDHGLGFHYYFKDNGTQSNNITPYFYDKSIYQDLSKNQTQYMSDNPTTKKAQQEIVELEKRHMGIDKNISAIYFDSNNQLHIGGYCNEDDIKLSIGGTEFKTKVHPATYWAQYKSTNDHFWVSEPIDPLLILNKQISLSDEKDKPYKTIEVRHGADGVISTHRSEISHASEYHIKYNSNKNGTSISIQKGSGM